ENDVLELGRVELGHLTQDVGGAVGGQVARPGQVERPAERLRQRCPRNGDDDSLSHGNLPYTDIHFVDKSLPTRAYSTDPSPHRRPRAMKSFHLVFTFCVLVGINTVN